MNMIYEDFSSQLSFILTHSHLAKEYHLYWTIIANPGAGGFTRKSHWKKHYEILMSCAKLAASYPQNNKASPSKTSLSEGNKHGLILTTGRGHASKICETLIKEASENKSSFIQKKPLYLIITAGGDGTSLEVMSGLFHAPKNTRTSFAILRLPMGTGNDGADSFELDKALDLLIKPSQILLQRAVILNTKSQKSEQFLAFNILSVGLDAYVTHMTNKMKGKFPGDFYKLWVNIAALLYDKIYKIDSMNVRGFDAKGHEIISFSERLLLLAVGESGHRCYGSRKMILPDERNVCAIKQMTLLRKLALKSLFIRGGHINKPESILFNANSVEIIYSHPILAQMDGEAILLQKEDFPVKIELTEPVIPYLKLSSP